MTIFFKDPNLSYGESLDLQTYEQVYSHMLITIVAEMSLPNIDILNTAVPWEKKRLSASEWRTLSHSVVLSTPFQSRKINLTKMGYDCPPGRLFLSSHSHMKHN